MIDPTFYFLHIPKTAGTSVTAWLQSRQSFHICPDNLWSQLLERDRSSLESFNFFAGHFYTALSQYLDRPLTTFTFLRHPVARSISHYLHIIRDDSHYLHQHARALAGFTAFMRDPQTMPMLFNFQTRALSTEFDILATKQSLRKSDASRFALEHQIEGSLVGYRSSVNLPKAKAYLDHCAFVGITERLAESLAALESILGPDSNQNPPPELNLAANRSAWHSLANHDPQELLALLADDMELYHYATAKLLHTVSHRSESEPARASA